MAKEAKKKKGGKKRGEKEAESSITYSEFCRGFRIIQPAFHEHAQPICRANLSTRDYEYIERDWTSFPPSPFPSKVRTLRSPFPPLIPLFHSRRGFHPSFLFRSIIRFVATRRRRLAIRKNHYVCALIYGREK